MVPQNNLLLWRILLRSRALVMIVSAAGLLAACDAAVDSVAQTAESVRTSAERMALSSRDASAAREASILAQGEEIERNRRGDLESALVNGSPRFEVRRGASGYAVYDNENGGRASAGGLTQGQAETAAADLRQQDIEAARLEAETAMARR